MLASNRAALTAANLHEATLTVTLGSPASTLTATPSHATFGSGVSASSFALVTNPAVTGLSSATASATSGSLLSNVSLRVRAAAHSGTANITSKALTVGPAPPAIVLSRNTAQTATVRGVDEADQVDEMVTLTHAIVQASTVVDFDNAADEPLTVTVTDDDKGGDGAGGRSGGSSTRWR